VDGGTGALLLIALVVFAGVVGVLLLIAFVAVVTFVVVGSLAISDHVNCAKRQASEVCPEDAW